MTTIFEFCEDHKCIATEDKFMTKLILDAIFIYGLPVWIVDTSPARGVMYLYKYQYQYSMRWLRMSRRQGEIQKLDIQYSLIFIVKQSAFWGKQQATREQNQKILPPFGLSGSMKSTLLFLQVRKSTGTCFRIQEKDHFFSATCQKFEVNWYPQTEGQ